MEKLLTIVICVYNGEKYIIETLQSVCNQIVKNFQLLIVDDCSTDGTVQCAEKYLKEHAGFKYEIYTFSENGGLAKARYFAERYVKTKYIIFLDADDLLLPEATDKYLSKIESDSDLIAVGCYLDFIDEFSKRIPGGLYIGSKTKEEFWRKASSNKLIFMHPTSIFNVEYALKVGGHNIKGFPDGKPRYQDMCEDLELWTRMSDLYKEGKAIIVLPEVLCLYRKTDNSVSTNTLAMKLRMKHIKENLLRRRKGLDELTYIDFRNTLTREAYQKIERDVKATDAFRKSGFAFIEKRYFRAVTYGIQALIASPKYVWQKFEPFIKRKVTNR